MGCMVVDTADSNMAADPAEDNNSYMGLYYSDMGLYYSGSYSDLEPVRLDTSEVSDKTADIAAGWLQDSNRLQKLHK